MGSYVIRGVMAPLFGFSGFLLLLLLLRVIVYKGKTILSYAPMRRVLPTFVHLQRLTSSYKNVKSIIVMLRLKLV